MSEHELNRIEVLNQQQVDRFPKDFQTEGIAAIRYKARRLRSSDRIDPAVRELAVTVGGKNYINFRPTRATEKLSEDHGAKVSRETYVRGRAMLGSCVAAFI